MTRLYLVAAALPLLGADPAVDRAVAYLSNEVPAWHRDNGCFSCHNNGDAARALLAAKRAGAKVDGAALRETFEWLSKPDSWDAKPLARVQFASALLLTADTKAVARAAELVAGDQAPDGHWRVDEETGPGAAATYGPVLGTAMAMRVLEKADREKYSARIARARAWLESRKADHALDVAALVWELKRPADIERLRAMQASNGSWNSEAFDTAVAILALGGDARGAEYLRKTQLEPGGWAGTTRPAGGASYAQHVSTTGWALLALSYGSLRD